MKSLKVAIVGVAVGLALAGCTVRDGLPGIAKPVVDPAPIEWDGEGHLVRDTEKLPMTGDWCQHYDHKDRRWGSPSNCVADY